MHSLHSLLGRARLFVTVSLTVASASFAAADNFGLGDGHSNSYTALTATDVVNAYAPLTVTAAAATSSLTIGTITGTGTFVANDLVMLWQVAGHSGAASGNQTAIDLSASVAATHFEFGRVLSAGAGNITLTAPLLTTFTGGVTQVIRVPEFTTVTIASGLGIIAPAWNGTTGGIVAFLALNGVDNAGTINVSGRGFRAGITAGQEGSSNCAGNDGAPPQWSTKGEGIQAPASAAVSGGMGNLANAGGGGNCHNAGGAGGGSRGRGGNGGGRWSDNADFGGRGGSAIVLGLRQLLFGGGGGAGHVNESTGTNGSGAPGGGVIFIRTSTISGAGTLLANGTGAVTNPQQCDPGGGGGAGGTIHLRVSGSAAMSSAQANGGKGGDHNGSCTQFTSQAQGVGGGGAAGMVLCQIGSGSCNAAAVGGVAGTAAGISSIRAEPGGTGTTPTPPVGGFFIATVTAPADGSATPNQQPTLTASGDPGVTMFIFVDAVQVCSGTADASGVFSCTPPTALSYATHSVTAQESPTTSISLAGPLSPAVSFTIAPTPVVTVDAPAVINAANAAAYPVSGTCTMNAGAVSVSVGVIAGTATCLSSAFSTTLDVSSLVDGTGITVGASQTDAVGTSSDSKTTRKDTVVAAPVISLPADASQVTVNPTITGTSEPSASVTIRDLGAMTTLCLVTADGSGNWSCSTTFGPGTYQVVASQVDTALNPSATSAARTFTVVIAPVVAVTAPAVINAANASVYPVSGSCTTGAGAVTFSVGTVMSTTPCVTGSFSATLDVSSLVDGIGITVGASQTNVAGTGADSKTTRKDTAVAAPAFTTPAAAAEVAANPTLTGTGEALATVTVINTSTSATVCSAVVDGSGNWSCTTTLGVGSYTVAATQTDTALNVSGQSAARSFTVVAAPTVTVSSPAVINTANASSYPVSGTCSTGAGNVTVSVGSVSNSTVPCAAGAFSVSLDVSGLSDAASITVTASQTNAAGTGTDSKITRKDTASAAPVVVAPANASSTGPSPTLSGTAEALATVTVIDAAMATVCTATADALGNWSCASSLTPGSYVVTASQVDTAGNTSAASASTSFTVVAIPTVTLASVPAINSANAANLTITGTCVDAGPVTVAVGAVSNNTVVCTSGAFSVSLDVTTVADAASINVTASQTNAAGTGSAARTTSKDTVAGVPVIASPVGGARIGPAVSFSGTGEVGATVTLLEGATTVCTATVDSSHQWSCSATLANGSHSVTAQQVDTAGNSSPASSATAFVVAPLPSIAIDTPVAANATNVSSYVVSGQCTTVDGQVTVIVGTIVSTTVCTAGVFTTTMNLSTLADVAPLSIRASQSNITGVGSDTKQTVKDTQVAPPVIVAPAVGSTTAIDPVISGTAEANASVVVTEGSTTLCTASADASGQWSCSATLAAGAHTVRAVQTDAAGNTSRPFSTSFTVANVPRVLLNTPALINSATVTAYVVSGSCSSADGMVQITIGAVMSATGCNAGVFTATLDLSTVPDGNRVTISASQTNVTGTGSNDRLTSKDTVVAAPTIASPTDGSAVGPSPSITGRAEPFASVTVRDGSTLVCVTTADSTGLYSCITSLGTGAHSVTATQTDVAGNVSGPSPAVGFTVGLGPAVSITAPGIVNGANASAYPVSGLCDSSAGQVTVSISGVSNSVACIGGVFSALLDVSGLADATVTIVAEQTNGVGTTTVRAVTSKDTEALAPVISAPAEGSLVGPRQNLGGTAEPGATVTVSDGSTVVCQAIADSSGQWSCATTLSSGAHALTAVQRDVAGNDSAASGARSITVVDRPVVSLNALPRINLANEAAYTVSGTCTSGASSVAITVGAVSASAACSNGMFSVALDVSALADAASITVNATQTNAAGVGTASTAIAKDATAPMAPVIVTPVGNASVSTVPTVTGTAEPGATVTVRVDNVVVGTTQANSSGAWSFSLSPTTPVGMHVVTVTAVDAAGNASAASNQGSFTLTSGATHIVPTIEKPAVGGTVNRDEVLSISGKAEPGASVDVYLDGVKLGTAIADANGDWALNVSANTLEAGTHSLEARDFSGGAAISFTVHHRDVRVGGGGCGCSGTGFEAALGLAALVFARRRRTPPHPDHRSG